VPGAGIPPGEVAKDVGQPRREIVAGLHCPASIRAGKLVCRSPSREQDQTLTASAPLWIRVEKETAALGLFTASYRNGHGMHERRFTAMRRTAGGRRIPTEVIIRSTPDEGLPTVGELDSFLALQAVMTSISKRDGVVSSPVAFPISELGRMLGHRDRCAETVARIRKSLRRLAALRVTCRPVGRGEEGHPEQGETDLSILDSRPTPAVMSSSRGRGARTSVWLARSFLDRFNGGHTFRLDLRSYVGLRSAVARVLVPLLHVWLFASRHAGRFEKSVPALSDMLGLDPDARPGRSRDRIAEGLTELRRHLYLADWQFRSSAAGEKAVLYPGTRFQPGTEEDVAGGGTAADRLQETMEPSRRRIYDELVRRGIAASTARRIALEPGANEGLLDRLEWGDHLIASRPGITNPAGFHLHLMREAIQPPAGFVTDRRRREEPDGVTRHEAESAKRQELESAWQDHREALIDRHIASSIDDAAYRALADQKRLEITRRFPRSRHWTPEAFESTIRTSIRDDVASTLRLPTLEEFQSGREETGSVH
jgi:hypothetical protein